MIRLYTSLAHLVLPLCLFHTSYFLADSPLLSRAHKLTITMHKEQPVHINTYLSVYAYTLKKGDHKFGNIMFRSYANNTGKIDLIYIHRDFRNKGCGTRLLKAACDRLQALGCKTIKGHTFAKNKPAHHLFKTCGFTCEKIEKGLFDDIVYFKKPILS